MERVSVTKAANVAGLECHNTAEIKEKRFDIKVCVKKRVAAHRQSVSATGGGPRMPDGPLNE